MERGRNLGCTKCEKNTSDYGEYRQIFVFLHDVTIPIDVIVAMRRLSLEAWVYFGRRGVGAASPAQEQVFPRGALVSMVHCDVQVSSDVHHNTWSVAGQCRRSATGKIACRKAVALVRL